MSEEKKKSFNRSMRGYNPEEVDKYIAYLDSRIEQLERENRELEHKLRAVLKKEESSKSGEDEIKTTLLLAKKAADKLVSDAQAQADLLYSTARDNTNRTLYNFRAEIANEAIVLQKLKLAVKDMREVIYKQYLQNIEQLESLAPKSRYEAELMDVKISSYIEAVIEGMKQDVETYSPAPEVPVAPDGDKVTIQRNPEHRASGKYRIASVRDTIKELNKQILSDDPQFDEPGKTVDGETIIPPDSDVSVRKRPAPRKKPRKGDIFDSDEG